MNTYKAYVKYHTPFHQYEEVIEVKADNVKAATYIALGMIVDEDLCSVGNFIKFDEVFTEVIK